MRKRQFEIMLNTDKLNISSSDMEVTQGDKKINFIKFRVFDDAGEIDYKDISKVLIYFEKIDRTVVQGECTINENGIIYEMGTDEVAYTGTVLTIVELYGQTNEILNTNKFKFKVVRNINSENAVKSSSQYQGLEKIIVELTELVADIIAEGSINVPEVIQARHSEPLKKDYPLIGDRLDVIEEQEKTNTQKIEGLENEVKKPEYTTVGPTTDSIIQVPATSTKGQVCVEKMSGVTRINIIPQNDWENGTLSAADGSLVGGSNKIRTKNFISLEDGMYTFDFKDGWVVYVYEYESSGVYRTYNAVTSKTTLTFNTNIKIKIVVIKSDSSSIAPSVISEVYLIAEKGNKVGNFITGTKSTLCSFRAKAHNKNYFDGRFKKGFLDATTGVYSSASDGRVSELIPIEPNTIYILNGAGFDRRVLNFYDSNRNKISTVSQPNGSYTSYTLPQSPNDAKYIELYFASNVVINIEPNNVMLRESNTDSSYEPYIESNLYIQKVDENGKIETTNSLPNGVKDEFKDGKLYKRTNKKDLQSTDIEALNTTQTDYDYIYTSVISGIKLNTDNGLIGNWVNFGGVIDATSVNAIGINTAKANQVSVSTSGRVYLTVQKGTYTSLADAQTKLNNSSVIYQLAEPKTIENGEEGFSVTGSLESYGPGTTIQIDPYLRKPYVTENTTITLDSPITSIDKLQSNVNGTWIDATGILSADGKTITVSAAGTYKVEGVIRSEEHAGQETTLKVPNNAAAQRDGNTKAISVNANKIADHELALLTLALRNL